MYVSIDARVEHEIFEALNNLVYLSNYSNKIKIYV